MNRLRFRMWKRGVFVDEGDEGGGLYKGSPGNIYYFAGNDEYVHEKPARRSFFRYIWMALVIFGGMGWFVYESWKGWGIFGY